MGFRQKVLNLFNTKQVNKAIITQRPLTSISSFVNFRNFDFPYLDLDAYYRAYQVIPQLRAIIDSSAKAFARSNASLYQISATSKKKVETGNISELLDKPHPLYDSQTFKELFYKNWQLFNRVHVFKNIPNGFSADNIKGMYILPTKDVLMIPKRGITLTDIAMATKIEDIVEKYAVKFEDKYYFFDPKDIWTMIDGSLRIGDKYTYNEFEFGNYLYPDCKMRSLKDPLKIIAAAYETDLEMKINYGALGIVSSSAVDGQGSAITLQPNEIDDIQKDYQKYGTSKDKWKLMFTKRPMQFTPISLPYDKLQIGKSIKEQKVTLCDAFSYPILLLNELEKSSYSNMDVSSELLYTNKIIPESNRVQSSINQTLGLNKTNKRIEYSYSHVEALQKDQKDEAEKNKINTDIIINLNKAVSLNEMSVDAAINTLSNQFNITKDEAKQYISTPSRKID